MSLVAVCHRFHNCMCPSNSIPLYIIRHCGRLAPSYKSRFNVLPSALLNWMAFALGQHHIAFSRDPVIRRILFTPGVSKEARRFYLSRGVFPSWILWILTWFFIFLGWTSGLGHFNTLAQMLHFANWSFHFIRKYCHSADFLIPTNSMLSQLELFEIKRLSQLIILLKWFSVFWPSVIKKDREKVQDAAKQENWPRNKEKLTK